MSEIDVRALLQKHEELRKSGMSSDQRDHPGEVDSIGRRGIQ